MCTGNVYCSCAQIKFWSASGACRPIGLALENLGIVQQVQAVRRFSCFQLNSIEPYSSRGILEVQIYAYLIDSRREIRCQHQSHPVVGCPCQGHNPSVSRLHMCPPLNHAMCIVAPPFSTTDTTSSVLTYADSVTVFPPVRVIRCAWKPLSAVPERETFSDFFPHIYFVCCHRAFRSADIEFPRLPLHWGQTAGSPQIFPIPRRRSPCCFCCICTCHRSVSCVHFCKMSAVTKVPS